MADPAVQAESDALQSAVRARLDELQLIGTLAQYRVAVSSGQATLFGWVRSRQMARHMVDAARRVRGVSMVDDQMVADDELELRVAAEIGQSALNRTSRLVVRAELGRVRIGGIFASPEARAEALRVGGGVVGVITASPTRTGELIDS